jgi:hypothetical protein
MSVSKYIRIGLRADRNLSDVPDPSAGLANILDDLVPNQPFSPGDLQVINGLNQTDVWAQDLAEITQLVKTFTPLSLDENNNVLVGVPVDVEPRTRMIDQLINDQIVVGSPPYARGGMGPIATIFPEDALTSNAAQLSPTATIDHTDVFDTAYEGNITSQDYWIDGLFGFSNGFHPSFPNQYGGIMWDGWLSNSNNRYVRLGINSFFHMEKYNENTSSWETVKQAVAEEIPLTSTGHTGNANQFVVPIETWNKYGWNGLKISTTSGGTPTHQVSSHDPDVTGTAMIVRFEPLSGAGDIVSDVASVGTTLYFSWNIGSDMITETLTSWTERVMPGETQRIRITTWYPKPDSFATPKSFSRYSPFGFRFDMEYGLNRAGVGDISTPYTLWYKEKRGGIDQATPNYTYEHFARNIVNATNKHINDPIENEKPVYVRYEPVHSAVKDVSRFDTAGVIDDVSLTYRGGNVFTADYNTGLKLKAGDYLLFSGAPPAGDNDHFYLQISSVNVYAGGADVYVDPYKRYDNAVDSISAIMTLYNAGSDPLGVTFAYYVIKSVGVVGIYTQKNVELTANSGSYVSELNKMRNNNNQDTSAANKSDTDFFIDDVIVGDLVLNLRPTTATGAEPVVFDRITTLNKSPSSGDLEIGSIPITSTNRTIYENSYSIIFSHRGLTDLSTAAQCVGVIGKEVADPGGTSVNSSGQNQLKLLNVEGISDGMYVQYFNGVQADAAAGNSVQVAIGGVNSSTNTVTLTSNLYATIPAARTVIFALNDPGSGAVGTASDKELCVMPLNTAPPFAGTDTGLETTTGGAGFPALSVGGDFSITGVKFNNATSTEITESTSDNDDTANGGLLLKTPGGTKYWALFDS